VLFLPSLIASDQNFALGYNGEKEYVNLDDMPLEMVISRRMSIHYGSYYNLSAPVPSELVSRVLWAAYGYSWRGRTIPTLSSYPIIIYFCNEIAAYKFVPENQSLSLWRNGDYRSVGGGYRALIMLYIVVNTAILNDVHWGNAEAGCVVQSIYLMANALNLGTVCEGGTWMNRTHIKQELGLPENEEVLYQMALGYPLPPYTDYQNLVPASRPSSSELPEIQDSSLSLGDALDSVFSSHEWSETPLTKQELSQVLWASYGYSYYEDTAASPPKTPTRHRTVPSAGAKYPMRIYAANSSGVYQYLPEQHTLTTIVAEDRRHSIALASGNTWASSAPLIIAMAWDDTDILTVDTTYIEVGLIAQNVYLESAAWGLIADWGKADIDEEAMREALGLIGETHLHPASIITVGHPSIYFNLTITSREGGTTNPLPGTYNYTVGSSVNVTAIPSSGYSFDYWLLDGEERTENPTTVIMDANHTLEAVFVDDISPEISVPVQEPPENVTPYQNVTVAVNVTEAGSGLYNVTLWYSINNGTTWTPLNMTEISTSIYQTTIPGHENCTWVTYKIIAYDNNENQAINDNHGYYYVYHVIPELPSLIILPLLMITTLLAVIVYKRKNSSKLNKHIS
jgi:SagB-type dehydrogenase family enzyme